jgi:hypothetical protein
LDICSAGNGDALEPVLEFFGASRSASDRATITVPGALVYETFLLRTMLPRSDAVLAVPKERA